MIDEQLEAELTAQGFAVAISDAGKVSVTALDSIAKSSEKVDLSLKDIALNAAKGLGVDVKLALNEVNSAFLANAEQVRQVADGYNELKQAGMDASSLILASLDKLLDGAKSQKEIDAVRKLYIEFGKDGKLSTQQVEAGIDAINDKLDKTPALLDETARAFKELGVISQAEAVATAKKQMQQFELVKNSGKASAEQVAQALQKVQKSIEVSGDASQTAWLNSQKSALGLNQAVDRVTQATERLADSGARAGIAMAGGAKVAKEEYEGLAKVIDEANKAQEARKANNSKAVGNQFGTKTGIENFLKQAGLSEEEAMKGAMQFEQEGKSFMQYKDGKHLSVRLVEYAESVRYGKKGKKSGDGELSSSSSLTSASLSPQEVAGAFDALIKQSEARGAQNFAEQLIGEAKRRAR